MAEPYRGILGPVLGQVEAIKSARSNRAMDELQAKYLGERIQSEQFGREQDTQAARVKAARDVAVNAMTAVVKHPDPLGAAQRFFGSPQFQDATSVLGVDGKAFLDPNISREEAIANLTANITALGGEMAGPELTNVAPGGTVLQDGKPIYTAPFAPKEPETDVVMTIGPDGKPQWTRKSQAAGQPAFHAPSISVDMGQKWPAPQPGQRYEPIPDKPGEYRLVNIPGARGTEGQAKAAGLGVRMRELSPDIKDEAPSLTTQMMAQIAQSGGIRGGLAEGQLTPEQQKHFNAARGWLAGVLRGDTGATIQPFEIQEYYPTFFPVPGNSKEVIEQKRRLRKVTEEQLLRTGGLSESDAGTPTDSRDEFDPTKLSDEELRELAR